MYIESSQQELFLGSLATDAIKIGIVSTISWGIGIGMATITGIVAFNLGAIVLVGFGTALALQYLDEKFGLTDRLVIYLEHSQHEFVEKTRETEGGMWDIIAMFTDKMLDKGKVIVIDEIKQYLKSSLNELLHQYRF